MAIKSAREEADEEIKSKEFQRRHNTFKAKVQRLIEELKKEYSREIKISYYPEFFKDYVVIQPKDTEYPYYIGLEISSKTKEINCTIMKGNYKNKPIHKTAIKDDRNLVKNVKKFVVTSLSASKQLDLPF